MLVRFEVRIEVQNQSYAHLSLKRVELRQTMTTFLLYDSVNNFRIILTDRGPLKKEMGEEGGRKPSLDNPEYFLFPEEPPSQNRPFGGLATLERPSREPSTNTNRFPGEHTTIDRRARTVSQVSD